ncbi:hypothetical protein D3C76_813880 [compost metagenome]
MGKRIGACWRVVEGDVAGRFPETVVIEETRFVGQPVLPRIDRHAVQRRHHTRVERTVLAVLLGKVRSQGQFRRVTCALLHHPLMQLPGIAEDVQRRRVTWDVQNNPAIRITPAPDILRAVAIELQATRLQLRQPATRCLQLFEFQGCPCLVRRQSRRLQGQFQTFLAQAFLTKLQKSSHDEGGFGRGFQGVRFGCDDLGVRWPGLPEIGLVQALEIQSPDPLLEIGGPNGDLSGGSVALRHSLAVDAFVAVVVAAANIGKLVNVGHDPYRRPDIRWRVQPKRGFTEAPVALGLIVGQQRLHQGHGTCHPSLVDAVLRRMPLVIVIQGHQPGCRRIDVLAPLFFDQLLAKLTGGLRQGDGQSGFQFIAHSQGRRGIRACSIGGRYFIHGAFLCAHFRNTTIPGPDPPKSGSNRQGA